MLFNVSIVFSVFRNNRETFSARIHQSEYLFDISRFRGFQVEQKIFPDSRSRFIQKIQEMTKLKFLNCQQASFMKFESSSELLLPPFKDCATHRSRTVPFILKMQCRVLQKIFDVFRNLVELLLNTTDFFSLQCSLMDQFMLI